eukprot:COSAG06_NODE_4758_length_3977_cov_14.180763_5_plen_108_part_00
MCGRTYALCAKILLFSGMLPCFRTKHRTRPDRFCKQRRIFGEKVVGDDLCCDRCCSTRGNSGAHPKVCSISISAALLPSMPPDLAHFFTFWKRLWITVSNAFKTWAL